MSRPPEISRDPQFLAFFDFTSFSSQPRETRKTTNLFITRLSAPQTTLTAADPSTTLTHQQPPRRTMAGPSAPTTELHTTTIAEVPMPPILTMPDELFVKTFSYLLNFDQPIRSIQADEDPKIRAYNRIGLVQLNTSPLFLNRRLHKVANDVLHSQNCITLSIPTTCAIHNQISSNLAKTLYRHVSLRIGHARDPCDTDCVASCVRDLVTAASVQDRSEVTIELSQVYYTRYRQLAAALAKEGMALRFSAVGEAEATLKSVKMRFVWSDVYEAFKIMAGQKHEEIVPAHHSDVPLKLQQIKRKDPITVQRLTCVLLKYHHQDDSVGRESKWVEAEHTEREYERITAYAITGPDADVLWSEEN
ncbi:hypothetical protein LTR17_006388 [Elasticomyces elasticus]|nr:hypothetical protein LTR17_006388 [Elasticomyces elasticus]